jgi:DNA polymerase-3 subunit gamma/tau
VVDFQSLYRRYRPQRFAEVRGQDHVVNALRNAVRDDRVAHAYLFSGPRGTGKTSTARILAKALNCASPVGGEPCDACDSCVDITRGASFDVHELDAASNSGVDAMRDLVARAALATPGRWKVYIVDEVHMLSTAASNALLKTLEEPPDHVVFVLATTDPQKVLPTIRSRTQHYEFHLLDVDVLASLLEDVAKDAQLELPDTAVESAVRRGKGSARDALSALDQLAASGVVDDDSPLLHELLVSVAERDTARALQVVEDALVAGRDAPRIAAELLEELRGQFLAAVAPGLKREDGTETLTSDGRSALLGSARSVRAMEVLGAALVAMRDALDSRITLEVAIARLTHPEADDDPSSLLERIERLERRAQSLEPPVATPVSSPPPPPPPPASSVPVRRPPAAEKETPPDDVKEAQEVSGSQAALGAFAGAVASPGAAQQRPVWPPIAPPEPVVPSSVPGTVPADGTPEASDVPTPSRDELVAAWGDHVLSQLRPRVRAVFAVGRFVAAEGATAVLSLPNSAHVERASMNSDEVAEALSRHFGRPVQLRLVAETGLGTAPPPTGSAPGRARVSTRTEGDDQGSTPTSGDDPAHPATTSRKPGRAERVPAVQVDRVADDSDDEVLDPDDLDPNGESVPGDRVSWAEDRVMEAFPGAEEV